MEEEWQSRFSQDDNISCNVIIFADILLDIFPPNGGCITGSAILGIAIALGVVDTSVY